MALFKPQIVTHADPPVKTPDEVLEAIRARFRTLTAVPDAGPDDSLDDQLALLFARTDQLAAICVTAIDSLIDLCEILTLADTRSALIETSEFGARIPIVPAADLPPEDAAQLAAPAPEPVAKRPDDDPPMEPNPYMGGG